MRSDRLLVERYAPSTLDGGKHGWTRTRDMDGTIRWRIIRCDSEGTPWMFTFQILEAYASLVGASQARWEAAVNLKALRNHIQQAINERNELISAYSKGVQSWH